MEINLIPTNFHGFRKNVSQISIFAHLNDIQFSTIAGGTFPNKST